MWFKPCLVIVPCRFEMPPMQLEAPARMGDHMGSEGASSHRRLYPLTASRKVVKRWESKIRALWHQTLRGLLEYPVGGRRHLPNRHYGNHGNGYSGNQENSGNIASKAKNWDKPPDDIHPRPPHLESVAQPTPSTTVKISEFLKLHPPTFSSSGD